MPSEADNLRLNSLARYSKPYSKRSSRYVLESHSHCEVPAGCGGAVLRWRNPRRAIPLLIHLFAPGEVHMLLNGAPLTSARPLIPYGEHVLAWKINGINSAAFAFVCSISTSDKSYRVQETPLTGQSLAILSAPDTTWRYTLAEPPESWMQVDFDDSAWPVLVKVKLSEEPQEKTYQLSVLLDKGALPLGFRGDLDKDTTIWIRRRFTLTYDEPKLAGN